MTVRRIHALPVALAALLVVVVAGCGGGGSAIAVPELASFTSVEQKSTAADTARFELSFDVKIPGSGQTLSFGADGAFDTPARRAQLSIDLSSVAELMKGLGPALGGTVTGDLGDADDWKLDAIQDGDTAYIHFPLLAKQLPAGKSWIKGEAKDLSNADAGQLSQFGAFAGTDPKDVLGVLKAVSGSIEAVGTDTVRGVETSHYRAAIDTSKLTGLIPASQRQGLGNFEDAIRQAGLGALPLDVWIDSDQRLRKLSIDLNAKQPGSDVPLQASLQVELYDYGTPLELKLPPADQVVDAATLKQTR